MNENNMRAFTKGKVYKAYADTIKDEWEEELVARTVNDNNEYHIIKYLDIKVNEFFDRHFEQVEILVENETEQTP